VKIVSVMTTNSQGGGEFAAVDLLDALAARGHETVFLTNRPELAAETRLNVDLVDLGPKLSRATWLGLVVRWPLLKRRLATALRRHAPYDVLLVHFKKEQLLAASLPADLRAATAWAEWGPLPEPLQHGLPRALYRRAARSVRVILAVSGNTRDSIAAVGIDPERICVTPSAIDVAKVAFDPVAREHYRREWGIADSTFVVGCVARLHPLKRNEVLVDAMAELPDDVVAVFAGGGDAEASLRSRAASLGDRVRFLPTPRGYVEKILSACDVQVFAPQPREGSPRSIGFGQLTSRPVIATAAYDGVTELIGPGMGTVVSPPNDPHALATVLAAYRDDPERREREGVAGRQAAVKRYDPRTVVAAAERALERASAG
jgi:glycosyltransferase involved in cell wall biosynthesis